MWPRIPWDAKCSRLPYRSERVAGDGWVLAGDAASFIDPFYSPGLDFCAFTSHAAHSLVARSLGGEDAGPAVECYNKRFAFCYRAWFEGIYLDKYYYMGDAELMASAFLVDIAAYHLGPVRQVFGDPRTQFDHLPFDGIPGRIIARALAFYNRRLVHLAQGKLAAGVYGDRNTDWRLLVGGFLPDGTAGRLLVRGVIRWLQAEWRNVFLSSQLPALSSQHASVGGAPEASTLPACEP
jgi:hypothetical protein